MLEKNVLSQCTSKQIDQIADSVLKLMKYYSISQKAINVIKDMCDKGLLDKCSPAQAQTIVSQLISELKYNDTRASAANVSADIAEKGLLKDCSPEQIQQIVASLIPKLQNDETRDDTITIISAMAKGGALNKCASDQAKQIVTSLSGYLKADLKAEKYDNIIPTLNIMNAFAKNESAQEAISDFYREIASRHSLMELDQNTPREGKYSRIDVLDVLTHDQFSNMISSLVECSKNPKARENVVKTISTLAKKGELDSLGYDKIVDTEKALEECWEGSDDVGRIEIFLALHNMMNRFAGQPLEGQVVETYYEYFKSFVENIGNQYDDKQIYVKQPNGKFVRMEDAMYKPIDHLYISNEKKTKWVKTNDKSDFIDERGRNVKLSDEKYVKVVDVVYDKIETKSLKKQV